MTNFNLDDRRYMARAIQLARHGLYTTHPNPRVGCVLVRDGKIVGEGYHLRAGEDHAEVNALKAAGNHTEGKGAKGATAYVTLEPCSHHGRTPPCAQGLIDAGVSKVISAMEDPNPLVAGNGHQMLKQAGIATQSGLLNTEAQQLNPGFIKRMTTGLPFVRVKQAMSLDGRTAMASGESQWITGAPARRDVQRLRARSSAIITGLGTVLTDNPSMTIRAKQLGLDGSEINADFITQQQPLRVIMDSRLSTPVDAKILQQVGETIIFCQQNVAEDSKKKLENAGATVIALTKLSPFECLQWLAQHRQCNEVLVEAGAKLSGAFTQAGVVDEWIIYIAATLLGSNARPLFELPGMDKMSQQLRLQQTDLRMVGKDIRVTLVPEIAPANDTSAVENYDKLNHGKKD